MNSDNFKTQSDTIGLSKAIIDVTSVAKQHGLDCWLNYGALLGMVRENRLLPWNNDAHICCIHSANYKNQCIKIVNQLEDLGYRAYYYPTNGTVNVKKRGVDVNINCVWKEKDMYVRPHEEAEYFAMKHGISHILYWLSRSMSIYTKRITLQKFLNSGLKEKIKIFLIAKNKIIPKKIRKLLYLSFLKLSKIGKIKYQKTAVPFYLYEKLVEMNFYNDKVLIPEKNIELLRYIYGDNWKIPMENWSFYHKKNQSKSRMKFIDESWKYEEVEFI